MRIFISYRRGDRQGIVGRIHDHLSGQFGDDAVFMDIDSVPLGEDFRGFIVDQVARADVVLVVIGPRWGETILRRKSNPKDFVRIEIEAALEHGKRVIPVLLGNDLEMPREESLPESIAPIAFLNASSLDLGRDFRHHMGRVVRAIEAHARTLATPAEPAPDEQDELRSEVAEAAGIDAGQEHATVPRRLPAPDPPKPRQGWAWYIGGFAFTTFMVQVASFGFALSGFSANLVEAGFKAILIYLLFRKIPGAVTFFVVILALGLVERSTLLAGTEVEIGLYSVYMSSFLAASLAESAALGLHARYLLRLSGKTVAVFVLVGSGYWFGMWYLLASLDSGAEHQQMIYRFLGVSYQAVIGLGYWRASGTSRE